MSVPQLSCLTIQTSEAVLAQTLNTEYSLSTTLMIFKSNVVQENYAYGLSCGGPRTRALFAASMSGLPNLTPTRGLLEMGQIEEGKTHERQI